MKIIITGFTYRGWHSTITETLIICGLLQRFVYPVNEPDSLYIYQKCSAERKQQVEFRLWWWCQIWRSYWCISKHFWGSIIRLFGLDDLEYLLNIWHLRPLQLLSPLLCYLQVYVGKLIIPLGSIEMTEAPGWHPSLLSAL